MKAKGMRTGQGYPGSRVEKGTSKILRAEQPDAVDRAGNMVFRELTALKPARQLILSVRLCRILMPRAAKGYSGHALTGLQQ
jgi:hypothetical protein